VPAGGTADQVLAKIDSTSYNTHWVDAATGGGAPVWADGYPTYDARYVLTDGDGSLHALIIDSTTSFETLTLSNDYGGPRVVFMGSDDVTVNGYVQATGDGQMSLQGSTGVGLKVGAAPVLIGTPTMVQANVPLQVYGTITLVGGEPTADDHAATKLYVDDRLTNDALLKAGGTMTGELVIDGSSADITAAPAGSLRLNADVDQSVRLQIGFSTKLFVGNTAISANVPITLPADPTADYEASNKGYVDAQAATRAPLNLTLNAQTGTTYTLVLTDNGKLVTQANAAAITTTVPPNSSVAFPVGAQVHLAQLGAGKITVVGGSGVTVSATPSLGFRAQYSVGTLIKVATDTWLLVGDLA
jgi:hypothetical protein